MKTTHLKTGIKVSGMEHKKYTPAQEVENANSLINELLSANYNEIKVYSNSIDFVSAINYIGKYNGIDVKIYIDDIETTIDVAFEEFNKSYDLLKKYSGE